MIKTLDLKKKRNGIYIQKKSQNELLFRRGFPVGMAEFQNYYQASSKSTYPLFKMLWGFNEVCRNSEVGKHKRKCPWKEDVCPNLSTP